MTTFSLLLPLLAASPGRIPADSPLVLTPQVRALRTALPVAVDGRLDDPIWRTAERVTGFVQRDPIEGAAPSESTVVYVAYDDEALYVAARMYDRHADSIVARLGRRDVLTNSDRFNVYLDPFHDRRSGMFFGVNAAGTQFDGVLLNDDWDDNSWDGVWDARTSIDADGWVAELRIPYSQLRFTRADRYVWGINFSRDIARRNERDALVYTPKNGSGFVSRFPDLVGLDHIAPPRRVELLPYALTQGTVDHTAVAGDPFNSGHGVSGAAGLDAKLGLGSGLLLNATVNPDFGQVEVDPAVVNLSDVETVYEEKRPFFVDGASNFSFGHGGANDFWGFNWGDPDFFYSRRIGRAPQGEPPSAEYLDVPSGTRILGAVKVTGKVAGGWNLGALSALTAREWARADTAGTQWRTEVEPPASYTVVRGLREFADGRQGLGLVGTLSARRFSDDALRDQIASGATTGGVDGWTFLDHSKTWVLTGWVGGSQVRGTAAHITALQMNSQHYLQRPDATHLGVDSAATSLSGWAARFTLNKQKGNWFSNSAVGIISPTFDVNDLGLLWRANVINGHVGLGHSWTKPGKVFRQVMLMGALFRSYNWDGDVTWTGAFHMGRMEFLNYWNVQYRLAYNPQTVSDRLTRGGPLTLNQPGYEVGAKAQSDTRKSVGIVLSANTQQSEQEQFSSVEPSVEFRPAANVSFSVGPAFSVGRTPVQYVTTYDDPTATATYGRRYVFATLHQTELSGSLRLNWTFTPKLSLQLYAQPLISAGTYTEYKALARPKSFDFDPWNGGSGFDSTTFTPPSQDFNVTSLRGNAVLRWEYRPGSTLYFVWTQNRAGGVDTGAFDFSGSMQRMFQQPAQNIFMVKVSYWLNP